MIAQDVAARALRRVLWPLLNLFVLVAAVGSHGCAPAPVPVPAAAPAPGETLGPFASAPLTPAQAIEPVARGLRNARLEFRPAAEPGRKSWVEVAGLQEAHLERLANTNVSPDEWPAILAVFVAEPDRAGPASDKPPMLGDWKAEGKALRFTPRFEFEPGVRYRAVFHPYALLNPPRNGEPVELIFALPKAPAAASTEIVRIDPEGEVLPENLLRFYLHFSAPMSRGEVYRRVRMLRSNGTVVELPFLEIGEELWDPAGKRLTLLINPGRIKQGLRPREELGPVLEEGKSYTFVVDSQWPDAAGNPLAHEARRAFRAGPADDRSPDPKSWKLEPPAAGSAGPLVINFPEPLDRPMLERVLVVTDASGKEVEGRIAVDQQGKRWGFTPESAWAPGKYQVVVDTALEDLAGNSIARPFEVDVVRPIETKVHTQTVAIPFEVPGAPGR